MNKNEIPLHDNIVQVLHQYCEYSHAELNMVVERFIKAWTSNKAMQKKFWKNTDGLRDQYHEILGNMEIPPNERSGIRIDSKKAHAFHDYCSAYNFDPCKMATYLGAMFVDAHSIKEMNELKEKRDTEKFGSLY